MHRAKRARRTTGALALAVLSTAALYADEGRAQTPAPGSGSGSSSAEPRRWWYLWSRASPHNRVLAAMWTIHLNHLDDGHSNDSLYGVIWRGGYVATFDTTHGGRAYTVGVERDFVSGSVGPLGAMLGFRTGLVYGYDGELGWMAEAVPILPFAQPVVYARVGPLTADVTYTWVVMSLTAGVRF
jgi:hypothetical protein